MFINGANGATRVSHSVPDPYPKGQLDKFMSTSVGDFLQKIIPDLTILGGGGSRLHLILP